MQSLAFNQNPGRTVTLKGHEYLFFSGYAYLGMQHVPEFIALVRDGIDRYGWLFPSSRISNTRLQLYEQAEGLLSSLTSQQDTVLVSSGFIAGKMAVGNWPGKVLNLAPSHPAINGGTQESHGDKKVFAVDSVDPIRASITDFSFAPRGSSIIVDDSHGIGILGKKGEGIIGLLDDYRDTEFIFSYSLSKAFNINAGAVSCPAVIASSLRSMPEYAASTAPSPALLHAFIQGQALYTRQLGRLRQNIADFRALIADIPGIVSHPLLPVFVLPAGCNEQKLMEQKIIISSFAYPDPDGEKIQRVVLNALHTTADLEKMSKALKSVLAEN